MKKEETFQILEEYLKGIPVYNTHSHHLPAEQLTDVGLDYLLAHSYLNEEWEDCGVPGKEAFCRRFRDRSFYLWLSRALTEIYGIPDPLSPENWEKTDQAVRAAYQDPSHHTRILEQNCGYQHVIVDAYWNPGEKRTDSPVFERTYRINQFLYGYNLTAADHNGNNPYQNYGWKFFGDLDRYLEQVQRKMEEAAESGCVAFKCASAYDRGLDFEAASKEDAQKALASADPTEQDIFHFQNYIFQEICRICAGLDIPLQVHTGLGKMLKSSCRYLTEAIRRNPHTKFVLFHGSYPWLDDLCGLAFSFRNVYVDLCWLPIISTAAAERLLSELLDICGADRISWGCDTWMSEDSLGALLAVRKVLAEVLSQRIETGLLSLERAKELCERILTVNAERLYHKNKE